MSKDAHLEGAPFVVKTYQLVGDPQTNPLVGWSDARDSFVVWKPVEFASEVLPQYFKHNNFCSFIRQLNTYGFHKVDGKQWEFKHELFRDGNPHLLKEIQRRKAKKRGTEKEDGPETPEHVAHAAVNPSPQPVPVPVQTAQTAQQQLLPIKSEPVAKAKKLDHDDAYEKEEVEKLRDLNQLLMKEVVKLQQQQESTMDVINQIMEQLMESKKEQHKLHKKVAQMSKELPEGSVSLITPPPSPLHPGFDDPFQKSILSPPFFNINSDVTQVTTAPQVKPSPAIQYVSTPPIRQNPQPTVQPTITKPDPNSFAYFQAEDPSLLALDDLAHLELTPSIEQELAKLLQNTLSPPQSPQYQPNY